jgi:predicted O-methyltransferase YrrM
VNWHEDFIVHLASIVRPKVYVELGVHHCKVFNRLVPYCEQLIGVDSNPDAVNWMARSNKVRFVNSTTQHFSQELHETSLRIDLLFIDADHSKAAVRSDFEAFFPFVSPHGIILLHDSHPRGAYYTQAGYCGDGYEAIEQLTRSKGEYEMMTIPVHPGLTLCRKRKVQLSWMEGHDASSNRVQRSA